jgi:serine/threonine protein kinase/Tol biopolymer transport system component
MTAARIGPYEIVAAIGAGGMGEVFRARDTKLNRDVAIKVLPAAFADDPERLARFTREAQTLASLNHPNIAAIYGIEEIPAVDGASAGSRALVMELVDGEDLSAHIARGPIPIAEALPIARQIAEALEAAHEQGIVHRDLKPANVKVRADGTVKVLDFGLAKAMDPGAASSSNPNVSHSPTLTHQGTSTGIIIGTAAYMSPEQAKGKMVDRRTDIWAFGVVLYEMLTGKRAFKGDDVSETLASVLKDTLSMDALPADTPPRLERLIARCLDRDLKTRLRDIGEARIEIARIEAGTPDPTATTTDASGAIASRQRERLAWSVAVVATLACVAALAAFLRPRESPAAPQRIQFSVPTEAQTAYGSLNVPQISPDGRLLAFTGEATTGAAHVIWVRPMDALEARALAGTEGAERLFWSPDSRSIGYQVGNKILRIGAESGAPQSLCELPDFRSAAWTRSGTILMTTAAAVAGRHLYRVPERGGAPVEVTLPGTEGLAGSYMWPVPLPGGRHFLYLGWNLTVKDRGLYVGSLDGGAPVRLMQTESMALYADPGFLLFSQAGTLLAQRFDAKALRLVGEPVRLADDVATEPLTGRAAFSVSENGTLVYRASGGASGQSELSWFDRAGKVTGTVGEPNKYYKLRLSPDDRRVATVWGDLRAMRLSVLDLGNGVSSPVTEEQSTLLSPVWSPDGQDLAYEAGADRQFVRQRIGSQTRERLFESKHTWKLLDDWSPDGHFLLFHLFIPASLFAAKVGDSADARLLLTAPVDVGAARFSPDGKWVAYQVTESGALQVWVASFPAFDQRRRISPAGGRQPLWSPNGQELFYLTPTGMLMRVSVDRNTKGAIEFKAPTELFQSPLSVATLVTDQYAVSNDGQRFLFIRPRASTGASPPLTVVVNWAAELAK